MTRSLEERLRQLEDVREISELKAYYCNAVDCGWDGLTQDGDLLAELFVPEGAWEAVPSFNQLFSEGNNGRLVMKVPD